MLPRSRSRMLLVLVSAVALSTLAARAQDRPIPATPETEGIDQAPAHISVLDGAASLERDGRMYQSPQNMPLLAGDRLRTQEGRLEILFGDGSVLDVDHFTHVDLQSDALLRLFDGRVRLTVARGAPVQYRIDTPSGSVRIAEPGDYRVALMAPGGDRLDVELVVLRGSAELATESGATLVRAGERSVTLNRAMPSYAHPYNVAYWDAFERWVEDRRQARLGVASSQYLPPELYSYGGTFDSYGTWQQDASYGFVWYPRVSYPWRPYHRGRWDYYRPFGWTWIGYDPWAWPTHHYGRWGFSSGLWFWIPSRRWGPAWVSWSYAPGFVGWCPRGWNGRPVGGISVNIHTGFNPYAWTVLPVRRFVPGVVVSQHAVGGSAIPRSATFVTATGGPVRADRTSFAAPRGAPLYSMGRDRAVPRGASLPGTVPSMPAVRSPSEIPGTPSRLGRPGFIDGQPRPTLDRDVAVPRQGIGGPGSAGFQSDGGRRTRVRDAGVGGSAPDAPSPPPVISSPPSDPAVDRVQRRDGVEYYRPRPGSEQAVPRGVPLPGTVPAMPPVRSPSEIDRSPYRGGRHSGPPSESAPPPSRMRSGPEPSSPPPASRAPDRGSGQAAPRDGSSGRSQAVPRSGGQSSGTSSGGSRRPGR
jgi:FecR protein